MTCVHSQFCSVADDVVDVLYMEQFAKSVINSSLILV